MSDCTQFRTCDKCGTTESRTLPAPVGAFVKRRQWMGRCVHCGGGSFSSGGVQLPEIVPELMEEWATNEDLSFVEQDEDLFMADASLIDLLKRFVQRRDILVSKRGMLLSTLCVLIFDNIPDPDDQEAEVDSKTAEHVIEFLTANSWLFHEIGDDCVWEYVKLDVYPLIGLSPPSPM